MEQLDDTNFDVIIVGTGITESILSGAISRIGKKVLHLDINEYYGGQSSSFSLSAFDNFLSETHLKKGKEESDDIFGNSKSELFNCETGFVEHFSSVLKSESKETVQETPKETESSPVSNESNKGEEAKKEEIPKIQVQEEKSPKEKILAESRHYNIDITPKLQFSSGIEVELLISSGVGKYLEFKPMDGVYLFLENDFQQVPCSKGDVFKNKFISLLEKRQLSKFITYIRNEMEGTPEEEGSSSISKEGNFVDFLKAHSLTPKLVAFVLYAISFVNTEQNSKETLNISTQEGLELIKRFVGSIGRYGNTPFIGSLYGLNEFSQAYSRLSAVYGGVFMLRKSVKKVILNDFVCTGIIDSEGQNLTCSALVLNLEFAPKLVDLSKSFAISRCVCVTDRSLKEGDKQFVGVIPPNTFNNKYAVKVMQYSSEMFVCPKGKFLVHFTTIGSETAKKDLMNTCEALLNFGPEEDTQKPAVFYFAYFNYTSRVPKTDANIPSNVFISGDLDADVDASKSVRDAKSIFKRMFPDQEFLPKAHDEEDLVWEESVPEQKEELSPQPEKPDQGSVDN